ncbi:hypothetical protein [Streptomyces sp. AK08-02]|uniref:hypothetical protein n=1 Tax=Streptomyces sp. AK08-02 TaxID=3028654 RepID=UPI0029B588E7|nr:hypothetical protein [Streptomyces sp. AK08-02]MDX3747561.1 hypothetical protein [Streptomyces sp. AK08-02]
MLCPTPAPNNVIATKPRVGRSLVTDADFAMLATFCADEYGLERCVAERVVDQALALVHVMGTTRSGALMAPSQQVDPGWHTLILHTDWYANWCQEQFGYFLHHQPNSKTRTRGLMTDVVGRIGAAGFEVDERLWGTAAECNPPSCCGDGPCC